MNTQPSLLVEPVASSEPLAVPVAYQGGKTRLARQIVDAWWPTDRPFYDLCCGSGAVTIEMLNRGASVDDMVMVDAGPWGRFWSEIGQGTFDLGVLTGYADAIPADPRMVRPFMEELSKQSASEDTAEVFILLQASSFGGKALWTKGDRWQNTTFRSYWEPTATSNRRSHVNPMMPMPETLVRRVWALMQRMHGIRACEADVTDIEVEEGSLVYIDPPYSGTTAYGHSLDVERLARRLSEYSVVYVSEGRPIGDNAVLLDSGRAKGGISGERKVTANQEWLSRLGGGA